MRRIGQANKFELVLNVEVLGIAVPRAFGFADVAFGGKADIISALRNDYWSEGKRGTTQFGFGARDSAILVSAMS